MASYEHFSSDYKTEILDDFLKHCSKLFSHNSSKYKERLDHAKLSPSEINTLSDYDIRYMQVATEYKFPQWPIKFFLYYRKQYLSLEELKKKSPQKKRKIHYNEQVLKTIQIELNFDRDERIRSNNPSKNTWYENTSMYHSLGRFGAELGAYTGLYKSHKYS